MSHDGNYGDRRVSLPSWVHLCFCKNLDLRHCFVRRFGHVSAACFFVYVRFRSNPDHAGCEKLSVTKIPAQYLDSEYPQLQSLNGNLREIKN